MFASQDYERDVRAAATGLPVEFAGWAANVYDALENIDVLLVPSAPHEATTRVILEAFAAGVPVVAFPSGGIPEILPASSLAHSVSRDGGHGVRAETRPWGGPTWVERYRAEILEEIAPAGIRRMTWTLSPAAPHHAILNQMGVEQRGAGIIFLLTLISPLRRFSWPLSYAFPRRRLSATQGQLLRSPKSAHQVPTCRHDSTYKLLLSHSSLRPDEGAQIAKAGGSTLSLAFPFTVRRPRMDIRLRESQWQPDVWGSLTPLPIPEPDTWPDGTMRWLASSFDTRAIDGHLRMIAPFWGLNSAEGTRIHGEVVVPRLVVTWDAVRFKPSTKPTPRLAASLFKSAWDAMDRLSSAMGALPKKMESPAYSRGSRAMPRRSTASALPHKRPG